MNQPAKLVIDLAELTAADQVTADGYLGIITVADGGTA